jgi:histidine ammonia-lyase
MTVVVTGSSLTLDEVVAVARRDARVALDRSAVDRMEASRRVVEHALPRSEPVYGLTTGVAELKRVRVDVSEVERFNADMIRLHRMAQGPAVEPDIVRAVMLRLLNGFAAGYPGVRPALAQVLVNALNAGARPVVRSLGSVGQSDLGPNADLAAELFGDVTLAAGEALALLNQNAFSTGASSLALWDAAQLAGALAVAGALSLEGFAANLNLLHPTVGVSRPYRGLRRALDRLRTQLQGSYLWEHGAARNLQDPLTFRTLPQGLGALEDALDHAKAQLTVELNASQGNPIVALEEERVISVGNFDVLPVSAALDFVRIALAPVLTSSAERVLKLLAEPWSGLSPGLNPRRDAGLGLGELGVADQALVAEARLLAQPVSFEVVSSSLAEGIEDRVTMAPLSARRLAEMVTLGNRAAAIELVVAAQAVELRGVKPLGKGSEEAIALIRRHVPFLREPAQFPSDLDGVVELVSSGALSGLVPAATAPD